MDDLKQETTEIMDQMRHILQSKPGYEESKVKIDMDKLQQELDKAFEKEEKDNG